LAGETQIAPLPGTPADPDLALLVCRWKALPEALRAGIVAMVRAAGPAPGDRT
jgi:hypothetical protein